MPTIQKQTKIYRTEYLDDHGDPCVLVATVRHDDSCKNGHNSFTITADLYDRTDRPPGEPSTIHAATGKRLWYGAGGCLHDEVAKRLPELAPFIKWHLCSTDEPMRYVANTVYLAGDRDHWGLRKGETRQIRNGKTGTLAWELATVDTYGNKVSPEHYLDSDTCPVDSWTTRYVPWNRIGEGKPRELDAARRAAVWPDATDAELCAPPEELKKALIARLPALMADFKRDVESLGLVF